MVKHVLIHATACQFLVVSLCPPNLCTNKLVTGRGARLQHDILLCSTYGRCCLATVPVCEHCRGPVASWVLWHAGPSKPQQLAKPGHCSDRKRTSESHVREQDAAAELATCGIQNSVVAGS